jgi:hypothetical protein
MGPKMVHVTADTCVRCGEHGGVQNGPSPVYEPDAPPRVTEAKTGGAAHCFLFAFSARCGTDAGAATAATG